MQQGEDWRREIDAEYYKRSQRLNAMDLNALTEERFKISENVIKLYDKLNSTNPPDPNPDKLRYAFETEQKLYEAIEERINALENSSSVLKRGTPPQHKPSWLQPAKEPNLSSSRGILQNTAVQRVKLGEGRKTSSPASLDSSNKSGANLANSSTIASSTSSSSKSESDGDTQRKFVSQATPNPAAQPSPSPTAAQEEYTARVLIVPRGSTATPNPAAQPSPSPTAAQREFTTRFLKVSRSSSAPLPHEMLSSTRKIVTEVNKAGSITIDILNKLLTDAKEQNYDARFAYIIAQSLFKRDLLLISNVKEAMQITRPTLEREKVAFPQNPTNQQKLDAYKTIISADKEQVNVAKSGEAEKLENKTVIAYRKYIGHIFGAATQSSKSCTEFSDFLRATIWAPEAGVAYDQHNPIPLKDIENLDKQVKMWVQVARLLWANNDLESLNAIQNILDEVIKSSEGKKYILLNESDEHFLTECRELFTAGGGRYLRELTKEFQESQQEYIPCIGPINTKLEPQEAGFKNAMYYTRAQHNNTKEFTETEQQAAANRLDRLAKQMLNTSITVESLQNDLRHLPKNFANKEKNIESVNILAAQSSTCRQLKSGIEQDIKKQTDAIKSKDLPDQERQDKIMLLKKLEPDLLRRTAELYELNRRLIIAIDHMQQQLPSNDSLKEFKSKIAKLKEEAVTENRVLSSDLEKSFNNLSDQINKCKQAKEAIARELSATPKDKEKTKVLYEKTLELYELNNKLVNIIENIHEPLSLTDHSMIEFQRKLVKKKVEAWTDISNLCVDLEKNTKKIEDKEQYIEKQKDALLKTADARSDAHDFEIVTYIINMKPLTAENAAAKAKEALLVVNELKLLETVFKSLKEPSQTDIASYSTNHKNTLHRIHALKDSFGERDTVQNIAFPEKGEKNIMLWKAWEELEKALMPKQVMHAANQKDMSATLHLTLKKS